MFVILLFFVAVAAEAPGHYSTLQRVFTLPHQYVIQISVDEPGRVEKFQLNAEKRPLDTTAPTAAARERRYIFTDDSLLLPARDSDVRLLTTVDSPSSSSQTPAMPSSFGIHSSTAEIWRLWSFASYSHSRVLLGRNHPDRDVTAPEAEVQCDPETSEVCSFRAIINGREMDVDLHFADERVYLPRELFDAYTSPTTGLGSHLLSDWPPLRLVHDDGFEIVLDAELFVPEDYTYNNIRMPKNKTSEHEWDKFWSVALRDAGVLQPRDDGGAQTLSLGTTVLRRYAFDRDYARCTMSIRKHVVREHMHWFNLLVALFCYTVYVAHKSMNAEGFDTLMSSDAIGSKQKHARMDRYHSLVRFVALVASIYSIVVSLHYETRLWAWMAAVIVANGLIFAASSNALQRTCSFELVLTATVFNLCATAQTNVLLLTIALVISYDAWRQALLLNVAVSLLRQRGPRWWWFYAYTILFTTIRGNIVLALMFAADVRPLAAYVAPLAALLGAVSVTLSYVRAIMERAEHTNISLHDVNK